MAPDWERISNGAVQVKIYPGGIAGGEQDMIRKMRLGVLQGGVFSNMGLAKIDHSLTVPSASPSCSIPARSSTSSSTG